MQQHRARRRRRIDPHASLELDFQDAMDSPAPEVPIAQVRPLRRIVKVQAPKVIEFPRPVTKPSDADFELAEPIVEAPRILDAPEPPAEQMDLLPAFADIQLEAEEDRRANQVELPVQPAAIGHRTFAGLVDVAFVLAACALFTGGFVMFAGRLPQSRLSLLSSVFVVAGLWLLYQYLFLVYSSATPGMQLVQLEICTFQGLPASTALRRWRALAGFLSVLAAGLGFAWALVDEDTLGWHDRITQTHVRKISR